MNILDIFKRPKLQLDQPPVLFVKLASALNATYTGLHFKAELHENRPRIVFEILDPIAGLIDFDTLRMLGGIFGITRISIAVPDPEDSMDAAWGRDRFFFFEGLVDVQEFERSTRDCYRDEFNQ